MEQTYLWSDRKRFLGMPLTFTRYALSEDRLFVSQGFLNLTDEEVLLYRVRDVTTSRSLMQRLLGVGTVTVLSSDKTQPTLVLKNVKDPIAFKELLHKQVEKMKDKRRAQMAGIPVPPLAGRHCHLYAGGQSRGRADLFCAKLCKLYRFCSHPARGGGAP